jgi:basic amino acid/polyamine antiporter, APA family
LSAPRRELNGLHAVGIVLGAIIGVGIFLTPAKVAAIAGSPGQALLLWAVGGLIAMAGALSMAEIGARFPTSGGEIVALHRMLGPLPAFLFGWSLLTAIQTGVLVIIALFGAANLGVALNLDWGTLTITFVATAAILGLAIINLIGVKQGAQVQTATSMFKLLVLAALTLLGIGALLGGESTSATEALNQVGPEALGTAGSTAAAQQSGGTTTPWLAGLAATLFSYGGFHQLTWVGGEVKDAQRTVPRAIVIGVILVITAYLCANWAYFALLPFDQVVSSQTLAADAVGMRLPDLGRRLTAAALCVSAFGIANSQLLTTPRVYFALAQEGLFPAKLGQLHHQSGVPHLAIILQAALAIALLWLAGGDRMDQLVTGVVFVDWVFHILAIAGLFLMRRKESSLPSYHTPWWPITPLVFIFGGIFALGATFLDPTVRQASLLGSAWILVGIPVYYFMRRPRKSNL